MPDLYYTSTFYTYICTLPLTFLSLFNNILDVELCSLYNSANSNTNSPFGGSGSIENATVVKHRDIHNLPGALLLFPGVWLFSILLIATPV